MVISREKVIYVNKLKIILLIIVACVFVAVGVWFLILDAQSIESNKSLDSLSLVSLVGLVGILFFGLCALMGLIKLFDKSPGLILNETGILDNSSGVSVGVIPWSEVVGINQYQVQQQRFVSIMVQNPEKYINTGNALKRMANRANFKMSGTPINISANSLKISYEELLDIIEAFYRKSRENA